jgi:hypothetical protein
MVCNINKLKDEIKIIFFYISMAFTRFKYDDCRTVKSLQQATDPGKWILDVPGNGPNPCYIEDPQIRVQKWGANLRTNTVNLESELMGVNRRINKNDCLQDTYEKYNVPNEEMSFPVCNSQFTQESRAIAPAWMVRDLEQVDWYYPPIDPQINTCIPFQNNLSTRILEKDYYTPNNTCTTNNVHGEMPVNYSYSSPSYVGGPNTCLSSNNCESIPRRNN